MAKILATGGGGFIGSAVAGYLASLGHEIHVLDRYDVYPIPNVKIFRGSVLDQAAILEAMEGCDYVFHLAAVLGVFRANANPIECLDVNIMGTRNVLECCVKLRVKKILFSSSSEVYGEPKKIPIAEAAPLNPKSEYGVSKVVGEEYCRAYAQCFGLPYVIVRLFNVYGDRQRDDFVMSVFTSAAALGQPLKINGDGLQTRAFCHVDDIAQGMIALLSSDKAVNETFNLGNPSEPITMLDLAKRILRHAGKTESLIRFTTSKNADRSPEREIHQRLPNIKKAHDYVKFQPKITLDQGIERVMRYRVAHSGS
jgi:UDP-glucose 4-epimerase